jgi:hypothetical protein
MMIFFVSTVTSSKTFYSLIYDINMVGAGWSALALDGIRMPRVMVLFTVRVPGL